MNPIQKNTPSNVNISSAIDSVENKLIFLNDQNQEIGELSLKVLNPSEKGINRLYTDDETRKIENHVLLLVSERGGKREHYIAVKTNEIAKLLGENVETINGMSADNVQKRINQHLHELSPVSCNEEIVAIHNKPSIRTRVEVLSHVVLKKTKGAMKKGAKQLRKAWETGNRIYATDKYKHIRSNLTQKDRKDFQFQPMEGLSDEQKNEIMPKAKQLLPGNDPKIKFEILHKNPDILSDDFLGFIATEASTEEEKQIRDELIIIRKYDPTTFIECRPDSRLTEGYERFLKMFETSLPTFNKINTHQEKLKKHYMSKIINSKIRDLIDNEKFVNTVKDYTTKTNNEKNPLKKVLLMHELSDIILNDYFQDDDIGGDEMNEIFQVMSLTVPSEQRVQFLNGIHSSALFLNGLFHEPDSYQKLTGEKLSPALQYRCASLSATLQNIIDEIIQREKSGAPSISKEKATEMAKLHRPDDIIKFLKDMKSNFENNSTGWMGVINAFNKEQLSDYTVKITDLYLYLDEDDKNFSIVEEAMRPLKELTG